MANRRADHIGEQRTAYEKNRKRILATASVCGICGQLLDPSYKYPHPLSITVDHIIPIAKGGHPCDISNLQAAHRYCNRQKSDKLIDITTRFASEAQEVFNNDLPLHYDWKNYQAT